MANTQTVQIDALRSLAFSGISATYAPVGTKFVNPVRLLVITNTTNGNLLFSLNASTDQLFVPAASFKLFDFTTNKILVDPMWVLPAGTQIYVKESSTPTSGSVYVECLYGTLS